MCATRMLDDVLVDLKRRQWLAQSTCVLLCARFAPHAIAAPAEQLPYEILIRTNVQVPFAVASCGALENEIAALKALAARINASPRTFGQEYMDRALTRRKQLKEAIEEARRIEQNAKLDRLFGVIGLAAAAVLLGLAIAFTSPIAVATIAAMQIVAAPVLLGMQLYFKHESKAPSLVVAYAQDRAMSLGEIAGESAGSTGGRLIAKSLQALSLAASAWTLMEAAQSEARARVELTMARNAFEAVDQLIHKMGNNATHWGGVMRNATEGAAERLQEFVNATRHLNCVVTVPTGPVIRSL